MLGEGEARSLRASSRNLERQRLASGGPRGGVDLSLYLTSHLLHESAPLNKLIIEKEPANKKADMKSRL